jgi:hypothetical protein
MLSSILATSFSSSSVRSLASLVGSSLKFYVVAPIVVSSMNESPGRVVSIDPLIDTRRIQPPPSAGMSSWFKSAHMMA